MRRYLQFRLRTLFVVTTIVAVAAFASAPSINRYVFGTAKATKVKKVAQSQNIEEYKIRLPAYEGGPIPDFPPATKASEFDIVKAIGDYRQVIARRDAATTEKERYQLNEFARLMREEWKKWEGENSLHEIVFPPPESP